MTDPGYFIMARGWMEHGTLKSDEPYSRREAWVWMVEQAFWAPGRVSINGKTVPIERGQFSHSYRFMATAWKWEIGRVQRFLARLKTDTMIGVSADTGQLVVTICNYDKYQMKPRIGLLEIDKAPIRERYATDTKKNESNKGKKEDIGAIAPLVGFGADAFEAFWSAYPEKVGKGAGRKSFDRAVKKASLTDILAGVKRYVATKPAERAWAHPATWLNQERWLDQPAQGDLLRDPAPTNGANGHGQSDEARSRASQELVDRVAQRLGWKGGDDLVDPADGDADPVLPPDARRH